MKKLPRYLPPSQVLPCYPPDAPLCAVSCAQGRYFVIATRFHEISFNEFAGFRFPNCKATRSHPPFVRGFIAALPFAHEASLDSLPLSRSEKQERPAIVCAVEEALIFDTHRHEIWLNGASPDFDIYKAHSSVSPSPLTLTPVLSDAEYGARVAQIVSDISWGRYYLLNYLRFFRASTFTAQELLARVALCSAPYRAVIRTATTQIYSLSPEQFVSVVPTPAGATITCSPIKGTIARHPDPARDREAREKLNASAKDRAELHITIDLARNDLNKLAITGSTQVKDRGEVRSFPAVHHLVGTIVARLPKKITVGTLLRALCPAASISGAPKREVLRTIANYEPLPRGFCMGNIVCLDESGWLDSSVLIRTLTVTEHEAIYAAGGGITLLSNPEQEHHEVLAKVQALAPVTVEVDF